MTTSSTLLDVAPLGLDEPSKLWVRRSVANSSLVFLKRSKAVYIVAYTTLASLVQNRDRVMREQKGKYIHGGPIDDLPEEMTLLEIIEEAAALKEKGVKGVLIDLKQVIPL